MDLAQEALAKGGDPRLADYAEKLRAIDGTLLPALPLPAESASGVAIQVYTALIAGLLLAAFTGRRPSKRNMELRLRGAKT